MSLSEGVVQRILTQADLSIDTRRSLGLPPRKIRVPCLDVRRRPVVYNAESQTLFIFYDDVIEIHRPIPLSYLGRTYAVFNEVNGPYPCTLVYPDGRQTTHTRDFGLTVLVRCITFKGWVHPLRSGLSL